MALKTVFTLKNSVAGILSGIDLGTVDDLNNCLVRAAAVLLQKADVPEASGIQNITLYSGVFDYLCDPRIFGTAINDIRPQGISRSPNNFVTKLDQETFDRTKGRYYPSGTRSTFQYANGIPTIRIQAPFPKQQAVLDPMNAITGWTAGGNASLLAQDVTVFYQSPASLRFTLTGAGAGSLTKTINATNLSLYQGVGVAFLAIEMPATATATNLTSIELRIGSDASNYSTVTSTTGFLGAWVSGNWLLVAFDQALSTSVGTPNWSAITYLDVVLNTAATITNFRLGGLFLSFPTPAQILYQSGAIFVPTGSSVASTAITADTDTIILTDPAYNIYQYECALAVLQNTGAGASDATSLKIDGILNSSYTRTGKILTRGLYDLYKGDNPSQVIRVSGTWYSNDMGYGGGTNNSNWS